MDEKKKVEAHRTETGPQKPPLELPAEIFKAELEAINLRRTRSEIPETTTAPKPAVELGLNGLALSGGGIRSATFCLGVLQALAASGFLKKIDYLSTVSGGGYIGTSLTWLLSKYSGGDFGVDKDTFPYGTRDPETTAPEEQSIQDKMLKFLREHGNYLAPGSGITLLSGIGVVLRGVFLNLLVWIPSLIVVMAILLNLSRGLPSPWLVGKGYPQLYGYMLWGALTFAAIFALGSFFYSLLSYLIWLFPEKPLYTMRRWFESKVRYVLVLGTALLIFGTIPAVTAFLKEQNAEAGGPIAVLVGVASGFWTFFQSGKRGDGKIPLGLIASLGSALFIYGIVLMGYHFAHLYTEKASQLWHHGAVWGAFLVALVSGWFVNLNYISLNRFYRDRLMETFLPEVEKAKEGETGRSDRADVTRLQDSWDPASARGPYHIINTNLVLVDSEDRRRRLRGGDSFILSPFYCGSTATGWERSERFISDGITLSTAMAISGAAANPNTAAGGVGPTRNAFVSLLMSLLNLRLGYWVPNTNPERKPLSGMNHFTSFVYELLPNGYHEDNHFLQLSDGGHFENLGIYELVRRKVKLLIVCDAAADPDFDFKDLQTALRRIERDFKAKIVFDKGEGPDVLIPKHDAGYPKGAKVAEKGYVMGTITYEDKTQATFIYIKTTMVKDLSLQTLGYKGANRAFPDQSTADQFFDEEQFEAYRELGYKIAHSMIKDPTLQLSSLLS